MPRSAGVSGAAVALAGAGALLLYSGLRGLSPLDALRQVATGKALAPVESKAPTLTPPTAPSAGASGSGSSSLVAAAESFAGDKYSQARRWQTGYSDCSSFVGKALKKVGIRPPGASLVSSYVNLLGGHWSGISKIPASQVQAGDLVISPASHMVIATDATHGIGQQRPGRNVQHGAIADLMFGTGVHSYWRIHVAGTVPA